MSQKELRNEAEKYGVSAAEIRKYLEDEITTDAFVKLVMVSKIPWLFMCPCAHLYTRLSVCPYTWLSMYLDIQVQTCRCTGACTCL